MRGQIQTAKILLLFSAIALGGCHALDRSQNTTLTLASTASATTNDPNAPGAPAGTSGRNPTMVSKIFQARCTGCHSEMGKPENGINYITDLAQLQARGFIIPGDAANSEVVKDAKGTSATCTSPRISDEEIAEISDYINGL